MNFSLYRQAIEAALKVLIPADYFSPELFIDRLIALLTTLGVKFSIGKVDDQNVGQCRYDINGETGAIRIAPVPGYEAMLILAHEAGHWLSHMRLQHFGLQHSKEKRELWAYLYGWVVLREIEADRWVSKEKWRKFHAVEIAAYEGKK